MADLSPERIGALLVPYGGADSALCRQLLVYLNLLLKWNARTNLTAVREPEAIVTRHFGESLFCASQVPAGVGSLLDFGSGAGFPGLPIALARPDVSVTLAESQGKKAAFLREAVRVLGLPVAVWAGRVEAMPAGQRFDVVTMRAVDDAASAHGAAWARVAAGGQLMQVGGSVGKAGLDEGTEMAMPGGTASRLFVVRRPGLLG